MENWDLGCKVRLGREQLFAGNKWNHFNMAYPYCVSAKEGIVSFYVVVKRKTLSAPTSPFLLPLNGNFS